ncbi:MAG: cytochrome c family protein [Myxococcales bacterium]|jgi:hypothetical protein
MCTRGSTLPLYVLLALIILLLTLGACNRRPAADGTAGGGAKTAAAGPQVTPDAGPEPAAATIAYTGNFRGFQKPCGCAMKQNGGLLRLGTVLKHLHQRFGGKEATVPMGADGKPIYELPADVALPQPLWYVECGNFSDPQALYPAQRTQTYLRTLAYLIPQGCKAAVPGSAELQLSAEQAAAAFADSAVPLVSCNLQCEPGVLDVRPYQQLAEGWYVTGVSNWAPATVDPPAERWWQLTDPVLAVREVLAQLPAEAHLVLVAMYQSKKELSALAGLPIAVLIGHGSALDKQWPEGLAPAVVGPPPKGTSLRLVSLSAAKGGELAAVPWSILTAEEWADDEQIVALVKDEREAVKEKLRAQLLADGGQGWKDINWRTAEEYLPDKEGKWELYAEAAPAYVGSRECRTCHPRIYEQWKDSRHARALLSLMQHDEDESLDCLKCHVTGLLAPSGFTPFEPDERVSGVTCESCHGPGSVHVGLMALRRETDDLQIRRGSLADCTTCHDSYNSPDFEPEAYWKKIAHEDRRQHGED